MKKWALKKNKAQKTEKMSAKKNKLKKRLTNNKKYDIVFI